METILELREKRTKAWNAAEAFLETVNRDTNGLMSEEDSKVYDKLQTEVVELGKEIDRRERARDIQTQMSATESRQVTEQPQNVTVTGNIGRASSEYNRGFWDSMRSPNPTVFNALKEGDDTLGGYLVPSEFEKTLVKGLEEHNIIRSLARKISTGSNDRKIPVLLSRGSASWVDEEGAIPQSDNNFSQVVLTAHKLATSTKVSRELLDDSMFDLESFIAEEFAFRLAKSEEEAFLTGNGNNKPPGLLADTGGAEIGLTAASATEITLDNVLDLYYSLKSEYRRNAVFIANDLTVKMLRKIKNENGDYIWEPSPKEGVPDRLFARPIYTSGFVPEAKTGAKALIFGDLNYYWIADRQGRTLQKIIEAYAQTWQTGYICIERVDGKLVLPEAVKVLKMA
jgi:HK97 family phage major capsid protein